MNTKTVVALTMITLIVATILLGVSANLKGWQNVVTNYPLVTAFVLILVILGAIAGWRFYSRFFGPLELKMREKYGIKENVQMDKKRWIMVIVFMVIPAIIGILLVKLLLKR